MNGPLLQNWLTLAAVFYLLGVATPLIVLRALTRDRDDGCILNLALLAIAVVIVLLAVLRY